MILVKSIPLLFGSIICILLTACGGQHGFEQRGYFKQADNRILTIAFAPSKTSQEVRTFAEGLYHTKGKLTAVYFYPESTTVPADAVTLAADVAQANAAIFNPNAPQWRYVFMRSFSGELQFIDCASNPSDDLCQRDPFE